jgi:hypothetical protein
LRSRGHQMRRPATAWSQPGLRHLAGRAGSTSAVGIGSMVWRPKIWVSPASGLRPAWRSVRRWDSLPVTSRPVIVIAVGLMTPRVVAEQGSPFGVWVRRSTPLRIDRSWPRIDLDLDLDPVWLSPGFHAA